MEGRGANSSCVIEEWLRSLNLVHYTQAFLDNGYDDLEICKQIGHPDLDAIGVTREDHREDILHAVATLKQQGATPHVYFILETPENNQGAETYRRSLIQHGKESYEQNPCIRNSKAEEANDKASEKVTDEYAEGRQAFKTFPKLHLSAIIRDKLMKHQVKLTEKPYVNEDGSVNGEQLDQLAQRYARDLKTHPKDVLDRLHEFLELASTKSEEQVKVGEKREQVDPVEEEEEEFSLYSVGGQSSRSVPPPLPLCPPPSHSSRHTSLSEQGSPRHSSPSKSRSRSSDSRVTQTMESLEEISTLDLSTESGDRGNKYSDTLSRILKSVKNKSTKKYSYKQVEGDLHASEITMSDEERINLMIMVKEGKISMEEAMHLVKQYEAEKRLHRQSSLAGSSEASLSMSPTQQKRNSKFSPFLLFKFGSQRKKKNSLSQGESSNSSLTSSPELSSRQHPVQYEATGTQIYSPIQGMRKKIPATESKSKSVVSFPSPQLSAHRTSKLDKVATEFGLESPKEKKKGAFSSPFSKRKKATTQSKGLCESPKASQLSVDRAGLADSPTGSRRGSCNHLSDKRTQIPSLSRAISQDCSKPQSSVQQETIAIVHISPQNKTVLNCDRIEEATNSESYRNGGNHQSEKLMSFKGYGIKHGEKCGHALSDTTVNAICNTSPSPILKQSMSSDNYEYAHHIESTLDLASGHEKNGSTLQSADFKCLECGTNHPKRLSHPLGYCVFAMRDAMMSAKRRNSPSGTPPETQSPKRQHFSSSPDSTIIKRDLMQKHNQTSPDQGTEMSPTGTLDSSSMREGHYGSNSTMSVGSETSPSCTIERTTLKPLTKKLVKRTLDKQAPGVRIRSNSFSTGDEYLSSDQEETLKGSRKEFSRNQVKRHSLTERSATKVSGQHSDHSVEMPSDPDRKSSLTTPKGESSSESRSSPSVEDDGVSRSKVKTKTRPQTVEALLTRLNIQHLIPIFVKHGYTTLRLLSNLEEDHLNDLSVENPEERAKLLTAAQMISDFEDQCTSYHLTSESGQSSQCNSPCRLSTASTNGTTHSKLQTEPSPVTGKSTGQSPGSPADNSHISSQSQSSTQKSSAQTSAGASTQSRDGLPLYENIDNFENAIPMNELILCHRGCQSEFSSTDGLHITPRDKSDNTGHFIQSSDQAIGSTETFSVTNHTGAKYIKVKSKPQVPERTVSLGIQDGSQTLGTGRMSRDASTQHGGVLKSLKKQSSTGSLIHSSPVSGKIKIKTAEVRHLHPAPHVSSPKDSHNTCPRHSSIPRLCAQHRKAKQTSPEKLLRAVQQKLQKEAIDLTTTPYSHLDGSCGLPVLLVQRYAEELQADLYDVATVFEAIRTNALHTQARDVILSRDLGDQCLSPPSEPQLTSVPDFLVSLGLPMYCELFSQHNVHSVEQLINNVHTEDLVRIGITDPTHIRRIRHWMKKIRHSQAGSKKMCAVEFSTGKVILGQNVTDRV